MMTILMMWTMIYMVVISETRMTTEMMMTLIMMMTVGATGQE